MDNQLLCAQAIMRVSPAFGTAQLVNYNFHATFNILSFFGGFAGYFHSDRLGGGEYWLILPSLVLVTSVSTASGQNARVTTS